MIGQNGLGTVLCTTSMHAEPAMDQKQMGTSTAWAAADHSTAMILSLRTCKMQELWSHKVSKGSLGRQAVRTIAITLTEFRVGRGVKPRPPWSLQEDGVPGT